MFAGAIHVRPPRPAIAAHDGPVRGRIAGQRLRAAEILLGETGSAQNVQGAVNMLGLTGVRRGGQRQIRSGQRRVELQHRDRLKGLGARSVEHRAVHGTALEDHRAVAVEDHQRSIVRVLANPRPVAMDQLHGLTVRQQVVQVRARHRRAPNMSCCRACHHARLPLMMAAGESSSSICARVSRPRYSTISATPRPLSSASCATSVAFS